MTIHAGHPFADPEPDPVRRLRGRLGGVVTLWTAGDGTGRAGLTVSSLMVANGETARVLALVDPDSDLADELTRTGRATVQLLTWAHRDLAETFAGAAPAPGGLFQQAAFVPTKWGPLLADVTTWAGVSLESATEVGWSSLVSCLVGEVTIGEDVADGDGDGDRAPLVHRRGRYVRPSAGPVA